MNFFGEQVQISVRGPHPALVPTASERADYGIEEGAFYGNLFAEEPYAVSCTGRQGLETDASPDLKKRVCATDVFNGKTVCGFEAIGMCSTTCAGQADNPQYGYKSCAATNDGDPVSEVVTVFLRTAMDYKRVGIQFTK